MRKIAKEAGEFFEISLELNRVRENLEANYYANCKDTKKNNNRK